MLSKRLTFIFQNHRVMIVIRIQGVIFLFVPLYNGKNQRLKLINAICKRQRATFWGTILPMKCHLLVFVVKVAKVILVKGDSISN